MTFEEVRNMPTVYRGVFRNGIHQSCFRSFHCLEKTKELLSQGVPHLVILEMIDDMMQSESKEAYSPDPMLEPSSVNPIHEDTNFPVPFVGPSDPGV